MVSFNDFKKLEFRVAEILEAGDVEGKDRLFKLRVSLGGEERQLVAGIKGAYSREELAGKQVVVVANLEPAKIAGIISNGMLLAAVDGKNISLLSPDKKVSPGTKVE